MQGASFVDWLDKADHFHRVLMREAKFTAPVRMGASAAASTAPKK
jgi:hypothetical protein